MTDSIQHVVIVGGGFAGIAAARALKRAPVRVTLVDRHNHHLFQPLLYQVATAGLSAPEIAAPIRGILRSHRNATVLLGNVDAVDRQQRAITVDGVRIEYDFLIVAAGVSHSYFGNDAWAEHAPGLKSLDDAFEIRDRVLLAWELAERAESESERRGLLTFVVVGAGPTGVELAGALAEIARHTMAKNFRRFDPRTAKIILIEAGDRVLPSYHQRLSAKAEHALRRLGVEVRTGSRVTDVDEAGVRLSDEFIPAATVLWAAGIAGSGVGGMLGSTLDRAGRVCVDGMLNLADDPQVFVVGDLAASTQEDGTLVPGLAPAAIQMGRYAGRAIRRRLKGSEVRPFEYLDKGSMATIGRSKAVAEAGRIRLSGGVAWLAWVFIHVLFLAGFRNRLVVLFDWAVAWITFRRGARVVSDGAAARRLEQWRDSRPKLPGEGNRTSTLPEDGSA